MQRKLIVTGDGSHSMEVPELGVRYHSIHGAIQESKHVFIEAGFSASERFKQSDALNIFEVGFGTGLNALLALIESEGRNQKIYYESIELFPLTVDEVKMLNYCTLLQRDDLQKIFERLHECEWETAVTITSNFVLRKTKGNLLNFEMPTLKVGIQTDSVRTPGTFELIFFDAFDPNTQPELWTEEIFRKMFVMLKPGGVLTTYSSKGTARRAMEAAGFRVEKIQGPPGKREIVRAVKI